MPDPRLNGRDACRVAPESDGRLLHSPSLRCHLLRVFQNPERGLADQTTENKTKQNNNNKKPCKAESKTKCLLPLKIA